VTVYSNVRHAITVAYANGHSIIGWMPDKQGWVIYKPSSPPIGVEPEILVIKLGEMPVALSPVGVEVLCSLMMDPAAGMSHK
jgi:hypothetical protein